MSHMLDQVSVRDARGVIADLMEKLGGPNGKEWLAAAKKFARKENPWPAVGILPVWKELLFEAGSSQFSVWSDFYQQSFLKGNGYMQFGCNVRSDELNLLSKQSFLQTTIIELVQVAPTDLGLVCDEEIDCGDGGVSSEKLVSTARENGLRPVADFEILKLILQNDMKQGDDGWVFPAEDYRKSRFVHLDGRFPGDKNQFVTFDNFPIAVLPDMKVVFAKK